jgi:hypothetical protein
MTREERREEQRAEKELMSQIYATKRKASKRMMSMTPEERRIYYTDLLARIKSTRIPRP